MRILIDGMDLSGKTTLAKALVATLREHGLDARRNVGGLHKGWFDAWAQKAYRRLRPGSAVVSWLFAATALADAIRATLPKPGEIVVQEAHAAHTIAFAEGFGSRVPAMLLRWLRPFLPRFDLIVHLKASHAERGRRFHVRQHNTPVDALLFSAPALFHDIDRRLCELMTRDGALILDTDHLCQDSVLRRVLSCLAFHGPKPKPGHTR